MLVLFSAFTARVSHWNSGQLFYLSGLLTVLTDKDRGKEEVLLSRDFFHSHPQCPGPHQALIRVTVLGKPQRTKTNTQLSNKNELCKFGLTKNELSFQGGLLMSRTPLSPIQSNGVQGLRYGDCTVYLYKVLKTSKDHSSTTNCLYVDFGPPLQRMLLRTFFFCRSQF